MTHQTKSVVKSLGVILDSDLSFEAHISRVTKTAFFHLRNGAKVRPFLTKQDAYAFITIRLDYCNALFNGLPKKKTGRKTSASSELCLQTFNRLGKESTLATLHWLSISLRIDFKVCLLTYKALNDLSPSYISDFLTPYQPTRALRSSDAGILTVPRVAHKMSGETAFSYAPRLWSCIRYASSVDIFKTQLETTEKISYQSLQSEFRTSLEQAVFVCRNRTPFVVVRISISSVVS